MNYLLVVQVFVRTPSGSLLRGNQHGVPRLGLLILSVYSRFHGVRDTRVSHPVGRRHQKPLRGTFMFIFH